MNLEAEYDRSKLKEKKRIVVKVGSSSLTHEKTGDLNLYKLEQLVRILCDLHNQGKEVILVSSGAIMVGRKTLGLREKPDTMALKQACASVGQATLITIYQKLFSEYNQKTSQILMTKHTILRHNSRKNARNTFLQLLDMGVIPIVNENDTVSTDEIEFGDNDNLSAVVASLAEADLLILLSNIDGLYTDDPKKNPAAKLIRFVPYIEDSLYDMAKGTSDDVGTGGMRTKLDAGRIATDAGCDMVIANSRDFHVIHRIMAGHEVGTLFLAHKNPDFTLANYIRDRDTPGGQ